ncbi:unnamed protein product [Cuscuta campestris]|uniref:Glutathione synthase substrate-binding domain-containing protein n=1 Tax=Cuscuta campestris TaxID=132261 RepID=A0A484NET8_9ASTE|nr:unnamed protein product [Cuscuta campestris]
MKMRCSSHTFFTLHYTALGFPYPITPTSLFRRDSCSDSFPFQSLQTHNPMFHKLAISQSQSPAAPLPLNCRATEAVLEEDEVSSVEHFIDPHGIDPKLLQNLSYDALVWSSLNGLLVGDRNSQRSGVVPGVGLVQAPFALLPTSFPESHWKQACEVAPIFNELVDRVSQDGEFLQKSLSRTKKVDNFTSRLLDIHSKMLEMNKKEEIRLGLHRSDYMLDEQTKLLLQIELNTISSSFPGLSCLVSELHRSLLKHHRQHLALDPDRIPQNNALIQFSEALFKAWNEYNNPRAVVMFVVQAEERNMYDQHWISSVLKERYP